MKSRLVGLCVCVLIASFALGAPVGSQAFADELDEVRAEIEERVEEMRLLSEEVEEAEKQIAVLDKRIKATDEQIKEKKAEQKKLKKQAADIIKSMYKNGEAPDILQLLDETDNLNDVLLKLDMHDRVVEECDKVLDQVRTTQRELEDANEQSAADKEEQEELVKALEEDQAQLEEDLKALRKREKQLSFEHQAALAQAAAKAHKVAKTFKTNSLSTGDAQLSKWKTGYASAYGGSTDETCENPGITATGTVSNDWSIGVAVPMAWGPENYYGKQVEISYDGQSIIAPVVDCGGMNDGERALDLQPGIWKAFGCTSCDDWGVRKVRYRFF